MLFSSGKELKLSAWSEVEHSVFASVRVRNIFSTESPISHAKEGGTSNYT